MKQQNQTLDYFKSHAGDWQDQAVNQPYSVIENRHLAVIEAMKRFPADSSILDVGCGAGQLAVQASKAGWHALGVDFAQEMISLCVANNKSEEAQAKFICASVFDFDVEWNSFDVISAQGFIEYISLDQLDTFFAFAHRSLKNNGAIALGSRNRLFNLHSLNEFTELEAALGTIENLIKEAQVLQSSKTQAEALDKLERLGFEYLQLTSHPQTGIKVDTRYQFSPSDLMVRLGKHGLKTSRIFPVHYHAIPLFLLGDPEYKRLHNQLAKFAADNWITCHNLIPYSSSFVIEARKI